MNQQSFEVHRAYVAENPVKAGLVDETEQYPFCFESLVRKKAEERSAGKAQEISGSTEHGRG
jgi:hypothetical protein